MNETTPIDTVKEYLRNYYGVLAVMISIVSIISTRLYGYTEFFTQDGVTIGQSDLYLNLRNIEYISTNWPFALQTDPYLDYPGGATNSVGLFDQIAGTITFLGQGLQLGYEPSKIVLLTLPIVFLALSSIPIYYTTKQIFNRPIAVGSVLLYPIIPSQLYEVSTIGSGTSETLAIFTFFLSLYFISRSVSIAERHAITFEVLQEISLSDVTQSVVKSKTSTQKFLRTVLLASLSLSLTGFTNSYTILLLTSTAIVFTVLYASFRTFYDTYMEPVLLSLSLVFVIPAVIHVTTNYLLLFEKLAMFTAIIVPLTVVSVNRYLVNSPAEKRNTILNVLYITIPTAILLAVYSIPQLNMMYTTATQSLTSTITSSYQSIQLAIWNQYGSVGIPAVIGTIVLTTRYILNDTHKSRETLLYSVAIVTTIAAYYTELNIYLTPILAILTAYTIYTITIELDINTTPVRLYKGYQISAVLLIIVLFIPILFYPLSGTVFTETTQTPSIEYQDTGEWFQENTPETGDYIQNPQSQYGLINNQNFGYKLSYNSERPVVGTDSGEHIDGLSEYMTANPESEDPKQQFTNTENISSEEFDDKYVVVDWRSVSSEFEYARYAEQSSDAVRDYYQPVFTQKGNYGFSLYEDKYYNSLATKLYHYHGSSVEPSPIVVRTQTSNQGFLSTPGDIRRSEVIKTFDSMDKAESFTEENGGQIGGLMSNPPNEVEHVENYRLVHLSEPSVVDDQLFNQLAGNMLQFNQDLQYSDLIIEPSAVKTFEKVEGATLEGSNAYPNSEVVAQVQIDIPKSEQPLVYRATTEADENGNYTLNVPYSTTGFDQYTAEDGYTNPDLKPNGAYTVFNQQSDGQGRKVAQVSVTEGQIYGEEDSNITVGLSQRLPISLGGSGSSGATISTGGN